MKAASATDDKETAVPAGKILDDIASKGRKMQKSKNAGLKI